MISKILATTAIVVCFAIAGGIAETAFANNHCTGGKCETKDDKSKTNK